MRSASISSMMRTGTELLTGPIGNQLPRTWYIPTVRREVERTIEIDMYPESWETGEIFAKSAKRAFANEYGHWAVLVACSKHECMGLGPCYRVGDVRVTDHFHFLSAAISLTKSNTWVGINFKDPDDPEAVEAFCCMVPHGSLFLVYCCEGEIFKSFADPSHKIAGFQNSSMYIDGCAEAISVGPDLYLSQCIECGMVSGRSPIHQAWCSDYGKIVDDDQTNRQMTCLTCNAFMTRGGECACVVYRRAIRNQQLNASRLSASRRQRCRHVEQLHPVSYCSAQSMRKGTFQSNGFCVTITLALRSFGELYQQEGNPATQLSCYRVRFEGGYLLNGLKIEQTGKGEKHEVKDLLQGSTAEKALVCGLLTILMVVCRDIDRGVGLRVLEVCEKLSKALNSSWTDIGEVLTSPREFSEASCLGRIKVISQKTGDVTPLVSIISSTILRVVRGDCRPEFEDMPPSKLVVDIEGGEREAFIPVRVLELTIPTMRHLNVI